MSVSSTPLSTLNSGGWFTAQTTPQTTVPGVVRTALLRRGPYHPLSADGAVRRLDVPPNPFKESFRKRLRALGGKYRATEVDDINQESIRAEEAAVAFERERWAAIEANRRGEPANPF